MTIDNAQQVVFIDSTVPDIQDLIDGVEPGVQVFVIDPGSDGVQQIADVLAANNLHDLSSISIVSHGADAEVMLGSSTLSEANLASYSRALAEIGTAVAPGGNIQLYGCDVALGATGQQFINDFSTLAGGVTVDAATHLVGSADLGASWTLDASSNTLVAGAPGVNTTLAAGPAPVNGTTSPALLNAITSPAPVNGTTSPATISVASPFTSQALANFQGDLATPGTGVLFYLTTGTQDDQRIEDDVNNTTTSSDLFQEASNGPGVFGVGTPGPAMVIDTVANLYFVLSQNTLVEGTLNSTADPTVVATWTSFFNASLSHDVSAGQTEIGPGALSIDLANHRIFIGVGSLKASEKGFVGLTYSPTTGAVSNVSYVASLGPNNTAPSIPEEEVYNNNTIYFINNAAGLLDENGVYRMDLGTGSFTQMVTQTQFPVFTGSSFPNGGLTGIALDPVDGRLFFSTRDANTVDSTQDAIYEISTGASNATATELALPAGVTIREPDALTYDRQKNVLYWADHDDNVDGTFVNDIVMAQLNAAGTSVVSVTTITPAGLDNSGNPQVASLQFDELPTLSGLVGTATKPTEEHGAVTLASGITISDVDNSMVASATVSLLGADIANGTFTQFGGATNDLLSATTGATNITASYDSATESLILTGQDSFGNYAQVLDSVTYTAGENPTDYGSQQTRTVDWIVSDGAPDVPFGNINSASSTITVVFVNDPPTLTNVASSVQFTEEHAAATLSGALTVTDPDDLNLSSATVSITGGSFAGDTDSLAVSGAVGGTFDGGKITVAYDSTNQRLTLSGNDTLAEYQAALREVTFTTGENPTDFGSHTTRTITWVAMDPSGTAIGGQDTTTLANQTTITVTNVNDPPTLALGTTTAQWTEEQSPAATSLSPTVTITDPDNLDLVSATVSITGGAFTGDSLLVSGQTSGVVIAGTNITPTFTGDGVVTFSGSDTLADYQSALELVTYNGGENPTDFGSDSTRTLTWTLNDGGGTANGGSETGTATSTIGVTFVNDPPTLSSVATGAQFTEEQVSGTTLSSGISVTDPDDLNLSSATVSITGGSFAGDTDSLAVSGASGGTFDGGKITVSYDSTNQRLTLSGTDTLAEYQAALREVTFTSGENPTDFGSHTTRTITWVAMDPSGTAIGGQDTTTLANQTTVTVTNVNDPPTISLGTTTAHWTEEQSPAATSLSPTVTITDADNLDLVSATVSITGGAFTGDSLLVSGQTSGVVIAGTSITPTFTGNGIVTFSGSDTLADYQSALELVTFNSGENPTDFGSDPTRTLTWTLNDGGGTANNGTQVGTTVSTISITNVNDPPTLSGVNTSVRGSPTSTVTLSPSVTVSDVDDLTLKSATVAITGGTFAGDGDVLQAEGGATTFVQNTHTITIAYNSTTETLTLTGTDTLADYQNVLDTVTWHSTAVDPTHSGSNTTRTLSWTVQDPSGVLNGGSDTSTPQTETLIIDQPPTLTGLVQTAQWTEEQSPLATTLSPSVTITDADGVNTELSATVSITGGTFTNDLDTLAINGASSGTLDGGNISYSYNSTSETLTLTGSDTLAAYQNALDGVTFNAGENPTDFGSNPTRTLTWTVADHVGVESAPVTTTIDITQVNDPPTLALGTTIAAWTEEQSPAATTLSPSVSITDADNLDLVSATVSITGGAFAGDSLLVSGQTSGVVIAGTNITPTFTGNGTVTFSGSDTLADYQSALELVTYQGGENPTDFGSDPTRTLTWTLNDGGGTANSGSQVGTTVSTIDVTRVNDAPTLAVGSSASWTEEGANATLSPGATVTDVDDQTLTGATVQIASGGLSGDQLEVFDTSLGTAQTSGVYTGLAVTYSYNSSTQTLTLSGTDTITDYNQVLDHVVFTSGENPTNFGSNLTRLVTWQVNDGGGTANNGVQLSSPVTTTVSITNVNDPPTLSLGTTTAQWTEEQSPAATTLSPTVSITDADNLDLVSATVSITGGAFTGDTLLVAGQTSGVVIAGTNITPTFSGNGIVTFSGSDTLADYQSALELVTFNGGENPTDFGSDTTRTLSWTLNDGGGTANAGAQIGTATSTVSVTFVNDPPTLTNVAGTAQFTEEQSGGTTLSGGISLSDPDDLDLSSATVSITSGSFAGDTDTLAVSGASGGTFDGGKITVSYDSTKQTLTLSGSDTLAEYQAALREVTFSSGENPTNFGSNTTRTISWVAMDPSGTANAGQDTSSTSTTTLTVTNIDDAPVASAPASYAGTEGTALDLHNASLNVSDIDGGVAGQNETATLSVSHGSLHAVAGTGASSGVLISGDNTGTLTITGSIAQINGLLNGDATSTLTLSGLVDSNDTPNSITLSLSINDNGFNGNGGPLTSNTAHSTITASDDTTVTFTGLSSNATGSPVQGQQITATIHDGGTTVATAFYTWKINGTAVVTNSTSNKFTPTEQQEGATLTLDVSFTDPNDNTVTESNTGLAVGSPNTVQEIVDLAGTLSTNSPVQGSPITLNSVTDGGTDVKATASYQWKVNTGGGFVNATGSGATTATYTPVEADESGTLEVVITLANDPSGTETTTVVAGNAVADSSDLTATVNSTPTEGSPISVTSASDGGTNVLGTATYQWQVNTGSGFVNATGTGATTATYTPTEGDEGGQLQVIITTADPGNPGSKETLTLGVPVAVQESPTENASFTVSGLVAGHPVPNHALTATVTEPDAPNSGITYTWQVNGVTRQTGSSNTYTPQPGDAAKPLTVTVSFTDTHGFAESGTQNLGNVGSNAHFDFNGDSVSDLAFQQEAFNAGGTKGTPSIWLWNGSAVTSMTTLPNPGASWHIVASADVNGDGKADLIWQNDDGQPGIWLMNGPTPIAEAGLANPGANWHLIAAGDFNADGKSDLLWQASDGTLGVWLMNGTTPIAEAAIGNPGPQWIPVGTADFNKDGHDDILLQNKTTGNLMIDLMNGTNVTSSVTINVGDPSWHAVSTGTFNGVPEIAWQNDNGTPAIWLFNGTTPIAEAALPNPGSSWTLVSVDHFTPDGNADLLWQNINGAMGIWDLNGTRIVAEMGLPDPGAGVLSVNGNSVVDPPGRGGASNSTTNTSSTTNTNTANAADPASNGTLRSSMPDATNAASVLNTSAPNLGTAGAGTTGKAGSPAFGVGAVPLSQNLLASDPKSAQHPLFTGA